MATVKTAKKMAANAIELPECPSCLEIFTTPIFQCILGHSLCNSCKLLQQNCPICRQPMTQTRNWQLEEMVSKIKVPCPNKSKGCVYIMLAADIDGHLKECIFREMECPLGVVFGRCSWNGKLKEMLKHFKERHPAHCNVASDADVELENVNIKEDERFFYLVSQGNLLFIVTMKIDTLQKMAYWTIQLIGSKKAAQEHIYEIHVTSKKDVRRKVVFTEHCFNDAIKADEVFRMAKCGILPLDKLNHFIVNKKMSFRFNIKRITHTQKKPGNSGDDQNDKKVKPGPKHNGPPGPKHNGPPGPKPEKQNKPQD